MSPTISGVSRPRRTALASIAISSIATGWSRVAEHGHRRRCRRPGRCRRRPPRRSARREVVGGDHHDRLAGGLHLRQPRQRHAVGAGFRRLLSSVSPFSRSGLYKDVVYEAGAARPAPPPRRSTGRPFSSIAGREVLGVAGLEVVGLDPAAPSSRARRLEPGLERPRPRARPPRRAGPGRAPLRARAPRAEVGVARAHREAVRLANGREDLDPHREVEVGGHPPDHRPPAARPSARSRRRRGRRC